MRRSIAGILILGLAIGAATRVGGAVIPIDDFDHRDPALPGWTLADTSVNQDWGPGVYDPSSGALRVYHSGSELVPPGESFATTAMFGMWNASVDPLYSKGYLRAKIQTHEVQNSTSIGIRADLSTATGYILFGRTQSPNSMPELDGMFALSKFVNGAETVVWSSGIEYLPDEEWNVELGAVGARITGKVWMVGAAEPSVPQFEWIDPDPIATGMLVISSDKSSGNTILARGDATFDDIVFHAVPEPSTMLGSCVALLATVSLRRTTRYGRR